MTGPQEEEEYKLTEEEGRTLDGFPAAPLRTGLGRATDRYRTARSVICHRVCAPPLCGMLVAPSNPNTPTAPTPHTIQPPPPRPRMSPQRAVPGPRPTYMSRLEPMIPEKPAGGGYLHVQSHVCVVRA